MPSRPSSETPHLGPMLAGLRQRAGMSQEELAERAGLSAHAISALECGARTHPYPHTVRSLADALDLSAAERARFVAAVPNRRRGGPRPKAEAALPSRSTPVATAPDDLVVPPTRLYGREGDITSVLELARSGGSRLITLTGVGGVGKTRLLAALADELARDYPDGVVRVALAALADARGVVPAVARALHIAGSDGPDALEVLTSHLDGLQVLLVLDNFEHLLSAAADVGHLVSLCPDIMVLASSRSPLRVRGEREYAVSPLALPSGEVTSADELNASPSGAFALARARAVSSRWDPTPENVRSIGQLCVRLAGLPLAIELATARLRLLSPVTLLERLEDVASSSAARDLPERQRTMRATLDWSFELLTPDQRALFTLFGVFRSGARLEDLEEVAAGSGNVSRNDVLGLLEQLVEQSLVVRRRSSDGGDRFDMLEPVAQYARSLLVGPEAARAMRAHAQVYAALAERAAVGYELADQVTWLARSEEDEANIFVAIRRSLDGGDGATAARIVWSLRVYWWFRGQPNVGRRWVEQCLAVDLPPALLGRVRLTGATMLYAGGDVEGSGQWSADAYRLATQQDDSELRCKASPGTGLAAMTAGDLTSAEICFRETIPLCREAGGAGVRMESLVRVWLGTVLMLQGDPAGATREIETGLDMARARGDRLTTYVALYNLAQRAIAANENTEARGFLEEGVRLSEQTRDVANLAYFLDSLAVVESADGHPERVGLLLGAAQSLREPERPKFYPYYIPDDSLRAQAEQVARAGLGDDAYSHWFAAGRETDRSDVARIALDPVALPGPPPAVHGER